VERPVETIDPETVVTGSIAPTKFTRPANVSRKANANAETPSWFVQRNRTVINSPSPALSTLIADPHPRETEKVPRQHRRNRRQTVNLRFFPRAGERRYGSFLVHHGLVWVGKNAGGFFEG
jgi:hypothetical protein